MKNQHTDCQTYQLSCQMHNMMAKYVKSKIVEGGYSTDTRYLEKLHQKQTQHATLNSALRTAEYKVHISTYIPRSFWLDIPQQHGHHEGPWH